MTNLWFVADAVGLFFAPKTFQVSEKDGQSFPVSGGINNFRRNILCDKIDVQEKKYNMGGKRPLGGPRKKTER